MVLSRAAWGAAAATAAAAWGVARQGFHDGLGFFQRQGSELGPGIESLQRFGLGNGGAAQEGGKITGLRSAPHPTELFAARAPMVMDGQGTALPTVLDYPVVEPVTVTAWVLVYSPHPANGSLAPGSLAPPPPPETALLSFGRPHPYPPDEKANCSTDDKSVVIAPAPGLHLSVGGTDEALRGRLFFGGAMDDKGRLTGFFSREPLPLNLWVHVALVLEPPAASLPEGAESRRPQAVVKGYIDGKLQGRLAIDVSQLQAFNTTAPSNDPHARAVFLWGGVRARATAMMTGALQHAAIYVGHAFTDAGVHAARKARTPWRVPDDIAAGLGLRPPMIAPAMPPVDSALPAEREEEGVTAGAVAVSKMESADARATRWLEEAVALLQHGRKGEIEEEEARRQRAHWLLSGAVLLGSPIAAASPLAVREEGPDATTTSSSSSSSSSSRTGSRLMQEGKEEERGLPTLSSRLKALMARAAAHRAVRKEQVEQAQGDEGAAEHPRAATNESSGDNSNATGVLASSPPSSSSLRLLLPPGIAARIAQLILAAQATHGLDLLPSSSFSSAPYSHAHTILDPLRLQAHARTLLAAGDSLTAPAAAVMDVTSMHDCAVAAAHYLSLAGWAAAHFGEELRAPSSSAPDALVVERMVVKPPEETLLLEGPEGALRRRRGGNAAATEQEEEENAGWWARLPFPLRLQDGELEFMRARAEEGEADALVWYAQSLYWGRHGLQPDRAAAARLMLRAAEQGHAQAEYDAGVMLMQGDGDGGPDTVRGEELVGRAAAQGFAPALTAHALWILQRGAEAEKEKETRRIQAAVQQHQEQEERQPWPPPPPGSTDSYLPVLEEKQEEEEEAHVSLKSTADLAPTYVKKAESLLRRAVDAAGELGCPEAHAALATLAGWGRMGLGLQLQLGTGGEEKEGGREEERVREIAGRLAAAASGGHARARVGLAAAFWDPMVAFDVSSSDKGGINSTTTSTRTLVVQGSGFGREPIVQIPSLRCSCPLALGLARPAAEMALSGVVEQALRAYDGGDDGVARRLYALAAEAGLLSAQVNAEALLLHHRKGDDGLLLQLRLLRQMALQGWAPAVRELGRMAAAEEEEGLEGVLEAIALYHLAGTQLRDSQALYELGALFEHLHERRHAVLSILSHDADPRRFALAYYRQAARTAHPHRWPPLLAYILLWLRTEGGARLQRLAQGWEDGLLLVLGLLLSRVLAVMAAAARRRREQEQQQEQRRRQERATVSRAQPSQLEEMDQQQDRVMVPSPLLASALPDFAPSTSPRDHGEEKAESEQRPAVAGAACGMP